MTSTSETLAAVVALALLLIGTPAAPAAGDAGPQSARRVADGAAAEAILLSVPDEATLGRHLRILTEEPHPAGSPRNQELADYVRDRFVEYGLEDVHFHDTPALLSRGESLAVDIVSPVSLKLKMAEDPYPPDADSRTLDGIHLVAYHAYGASGDVTAEVVYAGGGAPEDFARLRALGIEVRGKIVLMRYSEPYSYRGYKVYMAESSGAAGAVIYSDPMEDGYVQGPVYPRGPWGPASHIQLGAIVYDWLGFGAPFTFHWRPGRDGGWVEGPVRDRQLPRIPSIPMSYEDAAEILARLGGPQAPPDWQGALPFTYHIGPGPAKIRMRVRNRERVGTMRDVIGMIKGREEPEKWVVIGNHRDGWVHGAVDPSTGTAALLEVARAFGTASRRGLRPRRSVVFANWDAEEDLLGGSTSWGKDFRDRLRRDGVAYLNVDLASGGADFAGGATPALADFLMEVTRDVDDPRTGDSVYRSWAAQSKTGDGPEVEAIVGATDYTVFQEHIGMACVDMSFVGRYGVYHSQYDDFFTVSHFIDPGFRYTTAMARLWALATWRLADAAILPMRFSAYARAIPPYCDAIEAKALAARPGAPTLRLQAARDAARRWEDAAAAFERRLRACLRSPRGVTPEQARRVNERLLAVERAMTEDEGLKSRPFFKHLIYAPQPTYRREELPRLFEAIESGDWEAWPRYERQLVAAFDGAARLLAEARQDLESNEDLEPIRVATPAATGRSR